jgi:hypothetical protein
MTHTYWTHIPPVLWKIQPIGKRFYASITTEVGIVNLGEFRTLQSAGRACLAEANRWRARIVRNRGALIWD